MKHRLKTWPSFFKAILEDRKHFEYRLNDRNFDVGDTLILREYSHMHLSDPYSGRWIKAIVTDLYGDIPGLPENYVIMEIKVLDYSVSDWKTED